MKVKDKVFMDCSQLIKEGPITIVAFGDSITHGAFALDEIDYESVFWNLLRKKILEIRNYVPINVINAGIGGTTAKDSIERMDVQVLAHNPDLIIVCFGLNDVNGTLEDYISSLRIIFEKCLKSNADVIFMTPNMLNTYVSENTATVHMDYAKTTADFQNNGKMDLFVDSAVTLAEEMKITVCDCYSKWKELSETKNVTELLANCINHPTKEMHKLFANSLFDIIFGDITYSGDNTADTMTLNAYKGD